MIGCVNTNSKQTTLITNNDINDDVTTFAMVSYVFFLAVEQIRN